MVGKLDAEGRSRVKARDVLGLKGRANSRDGEPPLSFCGRACKCLKRAKTDDFSGGGGWVGQSGRTHLAREVRESGDTPQSAQFARAAALKTSTLRG